jgi:hypothetical protein
MLEHARGLKTLKNCSGGIEINDNPAMGGQGKYADLHPPMWRGGT